LVTRFTYPEHQDLVQYVVQDNGQWFTTVCFMVAERYGTAVPHIALGRLATLLCLFPLAASPNVPTIVVGGFTARHALLWNAFGLQYLANREFSDEIETASSRLEEDVKCQEHQHVTVSGDELVAPRVFYGENTD